MSRMQMFLALSLLLQCIVFGVACKGRYLLNGTYGVINHGNAQGKYLPSMHCEWLIDAGSTSKYITLSFSRMSTECSYDQLFVYDGQAYSSPMIGSFSGESVPDTVTATSGYMLIHFFSDRNYVLDGFEAVYTVTDCLLNCSSPAGHCVNHQCVCNPAYTGSACEHVICPRFEGSQCGSPNRGDCGLFSGLCDCKSGYTGYSCSFPYNSTEGNSTWYTLSPAGSGFAPRAGHATVFLENAIWTFGGHTLSTVLDDLYKYDFTTSLWTYINHTSPWPDGRHNLAAVGFRDAMYIYGGKTTAGVVSNELWLYNITSAQWSLHVSSSTDQPPALTDHTLTLVDDRWLYLFGGQTENGSFVSAMYRIDIANSGDWEAVVTKGGNPLDRRLVGHSAVYHQESRSVLVYGGFTTEYARFSNRTSHLHVFHVDYNYWSRVHYHNNSGEHPVPPIRAYHTAHILGNYMLVYGGYVHIHEYQEKCYDEHLHFYHLGCHMWVQPTNLEEFFNGVGVLGNAPNKGRFSHSSVVAFGDTLIILGGYRGTVLSDLIAYKVPPSVAVNQNSQSAVETYCLQYDVEGCQKDPDCVWCTQRKTPRTPGCIPRTQISTNCDGQLSDRQPCLGICYALQDCGSCTVQGQPPNTTQTERYLKDQCAWCVKESVCQKVTEPAGACNPPANIPADQSGWWGPSSPFLTSLDQCRLQDFPAGLHWLKYRSPPNLEQPDDVEIVKVTNVQVFEPEAALRFDLARLRGFIHPMGVQSFDGAPLRVAMGAGGIQGAHLNLNRNDSYDHLEEVARSPAVIRYQVTTASRSDGTVIFPQNTADHRYYTDMNATGFATKSILMALQWSARLLQPSVALKDFTSEFLEPFNSGFCANYTTCLACLSDISCGWCPASLTCELRNSSSLDAQHCGTADPVAHMTLNASSCVTCGDFVDCPSCAENTHCEWLKNISRCFRKGRYSSAVKDADSCPLQCYQRTNCSTCIDVYGECAWCSQTQTCFPFAEYVTRNAYGFCNRWVDNESTEKCTDCGQHTACKACLADFNCGWCGNVDNPTIGVCVLGDYVGASNVSSCSAVISESHNISSSEPADWSYQVCPDIQECILGLDDCHPNATCANTFDSYTCTCNRGFEGNGKTACDRTCYYQCIHGNCSKAPDYVCQCDLGWHGDECNTDCGCHGHSSCSQGTGLCDECQHWTMGNHCEICRPGSYGNAVTYGCTACNCNGHALESLGYCNIDNGTCYCADGYQGNQCESCAPGYYGDPRNGQKCYLKCQGRSVIANATQGALGALQGSGVTTTGQAYCLWAITPYTSLEEAASATQAPSITVTIEAGNINTVCNEDYVYIYDGHPPTLTANSGGHLLAAVCGQLETAVTVEVTSGLAVIQFEASRASSGQGWFNATYTVHSCPWSCRGHHQCVGGQCLCTDGHSGVNCEEQRCPNNCSAALGQGQCDSSKQLCTCSPGYTGVDCSQESSESITEYTLLSAPLPNTPDALNLQRMGHSLVHCEDDHLLAFGGYSLVSGAKNDMWAFNLTSEEWTLVSYSNTPPQPRWFHSAVCIPTLRAVYVLGGLIHSAGVTVASNELWKFTLDTGRWTQIALPATLYFPPLAGHTMTLVTDTRVVIIGGFSTENYFSNTTYELEVSTNSVQTLLNETTGKGNSPTGIYSHSAVYHPDSSAIYVFGGYKFDIDQTVISADLYTFSVDTLVWSILPPDTGNKVNMVTLLWFILPPDTGNKPSGRYGHTAVNYGDAMLVLGGYNGTMLSQVLAYNYKCNLWSDWTQSVSPESVLKPALGQSAAVVNDSVYVLGGYDSSVMSSLVKLRPPADHCRVHSTKVQCLSTVGCSACVVTSNETNQTYCYANSAAVPGSCTPVNSSTVYHQGTVCDANHIASRLCVEYSNCGQCLATWPAHRSVNKVCQWCSNCPVGRCVTRGLNCTAVYYPPNCRNRLQRTVTGIQSCMESMCQATDCTKCGDLGHCIWTRQYKRSSEVARTLSVAPIFDWNCFTNTLLDATPQYNIISMPPHTCPVRCYQHVTCSACLSSSGSEGGWQRCAWSRTRNECMSPGYQPLHCVNGECGHMITDKNKCPARCSVHVKCSTCLSHAGCGWCALGGLDGAGVCMEGGLDGPSIGVCTAQNISLGQEPLPAVVANLTQYASGAPTWAYSACPPENECANGHHECKVNDDCVDEVQGYTCLCKTGYQRNTTTDLCVPVCFGGQGCNQGTCVAPDVCECRFGWVGQKCATECQCNKHSTCQSDTQTDVCLDCKNNTKGTHCELCKPLYVGNPVNGGSCISCQDYCNNHSSVCLSEVEYQMVLNDFKLLSFVPSWVTEGPPDGSARCVGCLGNTEGATCSQCKRGYFRKSTESPTNDCTKCKCQGHGDTCDASSGANCPCGNNTKTPTCGDGSVPCEDVQCSVCKEYFLGIPTNGHHCYHKMTVDRDFCFDPDTQNFCTQNPTRLQKGQTVFFAVQPRYLNVDIRVTIDVTSGGVDVYFSPYNDTFIVSVDPNSWKHNITIDPSYVAVDSQSSRRRRSTTSNGTHTLYNLRSMEAEEMVTYVTIDTPRTVLIVRNVKFRLVITLPHESDIHNLKEAKFFTVLQGIGSATTNESFGNLYFRQDQPHIDLFVFFSVFFSSFFKFLSLCVLVWKIKQVHDTRQNTQRRLMEMEHMASRPFGKVMVYLDEEELFSQSPPMRRKRLRPKSRRKHRSSGPDNLEQVDDDDEFNINPIALEPTDDGIAAVGTVVVQLPGGTSAPVQAYLGSALMTLRVMYPTLNTQKNPVRRRTTNTNSGPNTQQTVNSTSGNSNSSSA
ncbi:multiple epidermal growth factor-like domains protein 8 isoform X3 [Lingula anatina]|uniref:Multiple epidermal growth factor-like domains protein 8 isoform X1 n=1 Tax=Lingula anatina TaxID=7574 RepID=A0A2R2MMI9_LINAN|nr:multiple epidermal growth factor-like domains protein 8 isoform X1 [Lingula anatina]XP_023931410.1 multiple epidermal growth factor-like domains protein 8 isoform X2 [Lingula anatina]XP_023931414.1 multiple epidermal growth factor-like domains protein 8 isoform X3 [Lingula anatina]|eukprot:XP_023931409.1 multiple epidermal growth factor-like domains protein 8 isoform X1 [Lingula anatina]